MTEGFFSGLKFSILGFFGVGKFWQLFFTLFELTFFGLFLFFMLYHLMRLNNVFDGDNVRSFKIICPKCRRVNILKACSC